MTAPKTPLTAKEVAERLDTDPKTLRVFLRANAIPKSEESGRYEFKAADVVKLKKQFIAWTERRAEARAAAKEARSAAAEQYDDTPFPGEDSE